MLMFPRALAMSMACRLYGITPLELVCRRRHRTLVKARALTTWALRQQRPHSYPQIGAVLERNHTSIINLHRKADKLHREDPVFRENCARMLDRCLEMKDMDHACS